MCPQPACSQTWIQEDVLYGSRDTPPGVGQGLALGLDKPHPCEPGAGEEGQEGALPEAVSFVPGHQRFQTRSRDPSTGRLGCRREEQQAHAWPCCPSGSRAGDGRVPAGLQVLPEPPSKVLGGGSELKQNPATERWSSFENDD